VEFAVEILLPFALRIEWPPSLSDKVEFRDFNLIETETPTTDESLPLAELRRRATMRIFFAPLRVAGARHLGETGLDLPESLHL